MFKIIKQKIKVILSPKQKQTLSFFIHKIKLFFYRKKIGKNTFIDKTVHVLGWSHVSIGTETLIGEQTWLNVNGRINGFEHIKIGNYCYIGRRNLLSSSRELIIGDFVMTSNDCKFLGNNHIFTDPLKPYIATGTTNDDVLKIGANVWVGAGAIVLGAVTIGHGSIIGAGSVVTKSIPPFSIAVGNPCKVIKRFDFKNYRWVSVNDFTMEMESMIPSEEKYLEILKQNSALIIMPKIAASSRFGDIL